MEVVCRDTAQEMKDAGFPQPKPEFGQIWYSFSGKKMLFLYADFPAWSMHEDGQYSSIGVLNPDSLIFAPTATDILRALNCQHKHIYSLRFEEGVFHVEYTYRSIGEFPEIVSEHENPAEACAKPWLKKYGR